MHFLVTPLTFLLCGSDPKEWSLDLKQEALKTAQRHNTNCSMKFKGWAENQSANPNCEMCEDHIDLFCKHNVLLSI